MSDDFKKAVWQKIVTAKINNQCKCLSLAGIKKEIILTAEISLNYNEYGF